MCGFHGNGTELSPQVFKLAVNFIPLSWLGRDRTLKVCGNQARQPGWYKLPSSETTQEKQQGALS